MFTAPSISPPRECGPELCSLWLTVGTGISCAVGWRMLRFLFLGGSGGHHLLPSSCWLNFFPPWSWFCCSDGLGTTQGSSSQLPARGCSPSLPGHVEAQNPGAGSCLLSVCVGGEPRTLSPSPAALQAGGEGGVDCMKLFTSDYAVYKRGVGWVGGTSSQPGEDWDPCYLHQPAAFTGLSWPAWGWGQRREQRWPGGLG